MLIDTHTHLYLPEFNADGQTGADAVDRATAAGVGHMIFPNVDLDTVAPMRALHAERPDVTSMAMGLHPTEIKDGWREALEATREELESHRDDYIAVGEIGIDLYWDRTFAEAQMQALESQLQWAQRMNLPVIIHCREGLPQTLEVLSEFPDARGVMHSFGGTPADVETIKNTVDFYFGINGIVTFKNSRLADTLPAIGTDRLLLETDSPYLAPVPRRGKRNESAYITHTAARVAEALALTPNTLATLTTANARTLFNLQ